MPAYIAGKLTTINFAVIQLCYSRHFYARAYLCQKQELMLDAHRKAFEQFGGTCKRGIYDNLKTAVKQLLKGHHRNLQEKFVRFCSHYLYEPDFCNPASGNEKGRVENLIGVLERNFFVPALHCSSIDELNDRLINFSIIHSRTNKHPETPDKTRYELFEEEQQMLVQLNPFGFDCCRENELVVTPFCLIYYDYNRYSVPSEYVGTRISVKAYADELIISHKGKEITRHTRLFDKYKYSLNPLHYLKVLEHKPRAFRDGLPFQNWELPDVFYRYRAILTERYDDGDQYFVKVLTLLLVWPEKEVSAAIEQAIKLGISGEGAVESIIRRNKEFEVPQTTDIAVKLKLTKYKAQQIPLADYDLVLRNKNPEQEGGDQTCQKQEEKK